MKLPGFLRDDNEHEVIRSLRWIYEHDTFTQEEISQALGWEVRDWQMHHGEMFRPKADGLYSMRYQAVVNYLEYIDLQEARRSSRQAFRTAIAAIVISAVLAIAGTALSTYQIMTASEVTLQQAQLEEISELIIKARQ